MDVKLVFSVLEVSPARDGTGGIVQSSSVHEESRCHAFLDLPSLGDFHVEFSEHLSGSPSKRIDFGHSGGVEPCLVKGAGIVPACFPVRVCVEMGERVSLEYGKGTCLGCFLIYVLRDRGDQNRTKAKVKGRSTRRGSRVEFSFFLKKRICSP